MSKKKSRRQRKKHTNVNSVAKTSVAVEKKATRVEPELKLVTDTNTSGANNTSLGYIRSDIYKTIVLSGFIIVFYTIVYYLLQKTTLLLKATQLLGLGS